MTQELADEFAARLLAAHRRVAALDMTAAEKGWAVRRLIALSDASKRDLQRASVRLERLMAELDGAGDEDAGAP